MNDIYILPQAAQDTLGGIKAAAVEDKYTQECRIDKETGKLYTRSADRFLIEDTFEGNPVMSSSCREGDISLIEGYGESTQMMTEGKNLLNFTKETTQTIRLSWGAQSGTEIGFTTNNVNYSKITQIQVKPNTSYSFYNETYSNFWVSRLIEADDNDFGYVNHAFYGSFTQNKQQYSFTTNKKTTKIFFQVWTPDQTEFKDEYFSQAKIAFYEGNLSYYEPYTGGAPSPSPDYPQEIKSSVMTGVKVMGKNLFNIEKSEFNNQGTFEITKNTALNYTVICEIQGGGVATISFDKIEIIEPNGGWSVVLGFFYADGTNYELYSHQMMSKNNQLSSDVSKSVKSIYVRNPWRVGQKIYGLQIEYGTTATPYEPYKEQTIPLSTPITLRGIPSESGNITINGQKFLSDYIGQKDGMYRITRFFGVYEVTGTEEFLIGSVAQYEKTTYNRYFNATALNLNLSAWSWKSTPGLCNILIYNTGIWDKEGQIGFCFNRNQIHIRLSYPTIGVSEEATSEEKNQAYINYLKGLYDSGRPLKILYPLENPTFEPLPAEDAQALASLKTFYPTSIISWETEDNSGAWGKTILKQDMKLYIQNKIKELSNNSITQIQNINSNLIR